MSKKKIELNRHRDIDQLFTTTYEFIKRNLFSFTKLLFIGIAPFIIWAGVFGYDALIAKGFNIFSIFGKIPIASTSISSLSQMANWFTILLYGIVSVLNYTLIFYFIKLYQEKSSDTTLKLNNVWKSIKQGNVITLFFKIALSLFAYLIFILLMVASILIVYKLIVWGFTYTGTFEATQRSTKILMRMGFFISVIFIALPVLLYMLRLLMRFSLMALYYLPLQLKKPDLNFVEFLAKCNILIEGQIIKYWLFIHIIAIVLFYLAYISSIPVYGLFVNMAWLELPVWGHVFNTAFKCFSYSLILLVQGLTFVAISISFNSLFAKQQAEKRQKLFTRGPLGNRISSN